MDGHHMRVLVGCGSRPSMGRLGERWARRLADDRGGVVCVVVQAMVCVR